LTKTEADLVAVCVPMFSTTHGRGDYRLTGTIDFCYK